MSLEMKTKSVTGALADDATNPKVEVWMRDASIPFAWIDRFASPSFMYKARTQPSSSDFNHIKEQRTTKSDRVIFCTTGRDILATH